MVSSSSTDRTRTMQMSCFHLVIEVLLVLRYNSSECHSENIFVSISESRCFWFQAKLVSIFQKTLSGFHLGIEVLLVSRKSKKLADDTKVLFQSRNQGAFSFKIILFMLVAFHDDLFQSRNRGAFGFKHLQVQAPSMDDIDKFQSRNRGAFGFKSENCECYRCRFIVSIS